MGGRLSDNHRTIVLPRNFKLDPFVFPLSYLPPTVHFQCISSRLGVSELLHLRGASLFLGLRYIYR
jgi:hypothetical protein